VETFVAPLSAVDDRFAWDEGEGDRTRDWWLDAHRRYFTRRAEVLGIPFDEAGSPLLYERFEVVHRADQAAILKAVFGGRTCRSRGSTT